LVCVQCHVVFNNNAVFNASVVFNVSTCTLHSAVVTVLLHNYHTLLQARAGASRFMRLCKPMQSAEDVLAAAYWAQVRLLVIPGGASIAAIGNAQSAARIKCLALCQLLQPPSNSQEPAE
jgi:hypothetical protein